MYCDFNPRLFKKFTSKKTKIQPGLSDDWEMIPSAYVKLGGFSLKSEKLNQEVADIDLRRFLQFCKEENLTIEGLKLKGTYVIGNDRSVYSEQMFNKWKYKFESRTETIIERKDYQVGHQYKTPCGAEYIYLGSKYKANIKRLDDDYTEDNFTNVAKKYYVISPDTSKNDLHNSIEYYVQELKQKLTVDLGAKITPNEAKMLLDKYKEVKQSLVCFEDTKPKNVQYELQEIALTRDTRKVLIAEFEDKKYVSRYHGSLDVRDVNGKPEVTKMYLRHFDVDTMAAGQDYERYSWSYSNNEKREVVITKAFRIGLVKN